MTRRYGRVTAPYTTCANEYLLPELAITEGLVTRSEAYINLRAGSPFKLRETRVHISSRFGLCAF